MSSSNSTPSRGVHFGLWGLQILLALAFLAAGSFKLVTPAGEIIAAGMTIPIPVLRFAGLSEVLGAVGLILPTGLRILPWLTPVAAACLSLVTLLAVGTHVAMGDVGAAAPPLVLAVLCAGVAWGRWSASPVSARGA